MDFVRFQIGSEGGVPTPERALYKHAFLWLINLVGASVLPAIVYLNETDEKHLSLAGNLIGALTAVMFFSLVNIALALFDNKQKNHPGLAWREGVIGLIIIVIALYNVAVKTAKLAVKTEEISAPSVMLAVLIFGVLGLIFELLVAIIENDKV